MDNRDTSTGGMVKRTHMFDLFLVFWRSAGDLSLSEQDHVYYDVSRFVATFTDDVDGQRYKLTMEPVGSEVEPIDE